MSEHAQQLDRFSLTHRRCGALTSGPHGDDAVDVMYLRSQHPGTGPGGRYPTRSRPILSGPRILGMAAVTALRRCAKRERENDLLCRADHRHEPHPLAVVWHRNQFLRVSTPVHEARHAEERPADLTERLVAISVDCRPAWREVDDEFPSVAISARKVTTRGRECALCCLWAVPLQANLRAYLSI